MDAIGQFLSKVLKAAEPSHARAQPILGTVQLVTPAISWNWPLASTGTISSEQFDFSDYIPSSIMGETQFRQSQDSFTNNYNAFLNRIDATSYPYPGELTAARKAMLPGSPPDPVPDGWTQVYEDGYSRRKPLWKNSQNAYDWLSQVQAGTIKNPGSFSIELPQQDPVFQAVEGGSGSLQPLLSSSLKDSTIVISSPAWATVSVMPAAWFTPAVLASGAAHIAHPELFFSDTGLLRGRISQFIVAYQPKFTIHHCNAEQIRTELDKDFHAFGIPLQAEPRSDGGLPSSDSIALSNTSPAPLIVAVVVEASRVQYDLSNA